MPIVAALIPAAIGAYTAIRGAVQAKKAQAAMRDMASPSYAPNQAIKDYYQTALNRSQENPYESQYYKQAQQDAGVNLAAGLGALRDRGASIGATSRLLGITNRNLQGAGVTAEQIRDNRIRQLGQAATMQAGEGRQAFQYNQYMPYETRFNMQAAMAAGGNQQANAGLQNMASGISNYAAMRSGQDASGGSYNWLGLQRQPRTTTNSYSGMGYMPYSDM